MDDKRLVEAAVEVRRRAYAPYSKFSVGAALIDERGNLYQGCNVENGSYGLTTCAERNAVATAVADGMHQITKLAVASVGGITPCGACRQVLAEFARDFPVLLIDVDSEGDSLKRLTLSELLPQRFDFRES